MNTIFFILYKTRSGSTYLANQLSKHPSIAIVHESKFIPSIIRFYSKSQMDAIETHEQLQLLMEELYKEKKFSQWDIDKEELTQSLAAHLPLHQPELINAIVSCYCKKNKPTATCFGIKKDGWYFGNIKQLKALLPNSKFIHIVRDGRASYSSAKKALHSQTGLPLDENSFVSAMRWVKAIERFAPHLHKGYAAEVRYEDLILTPEKSTTQLFHFLGITPVNIQTIKGESQYLIPEEKSHLHPNVNRSALTARIDAWQHELSPREIQLFEIFAGEKLVEKGYQLLYPAIQGDSVRNTFLKAREKFKFQMNNSYQVINSFLHRRLFMRLH